MVSLRVPFSIAIAPILCSVPCADLWGFGHVSLGGDAGVSDATMEGLPGPSDAAGSGSIVGSESSNDVTAGLSSGASTGTTSGDAASDTIESDANSSGSMDVAGGSNEASEDALSGSTSGAGRDNTNDTGGTAPKCGSTLLTPTTATASSVSTTDTANVASNAIDGMLSTRWESLESDPQWLAVDFGAPVFIGEVDILWEASCAKNYDLEISSNSTTWTTIPNGTITGNTTAASVAGANPAPPTDWSKAVVTKPLAASGRYLRMNGTVRCTTYGYSIWEMRAYGDTNASCTP
jgi:hypothetical protein